MAAVELQQLAEVRLAFAAAALRLAFALTASQPRRLHPTTKGFCVHLDAMVGLQMLGRQGRSKAPAP
jgi:hypothetical protein